MAAQEMLKRMKLRKEFIHKSNELIKNFKFHYEEYMKLNKEADEIAKMITDTKVDFEEADLTANQFIIKIS